MMGFGRFCAAGLGLLALTGLGPVRAQENLDLGKTPAQLYASDCAICHKSPQGLTKGGGIFGLSSFLREHYTASRESAAAIASYVEAIDRGPPPGPKRPATKRSAKGDDKGKPGETKPAQIKSGEPKPPDGKSGDVKPSESKSNDAKASEAKPDQAKAVEAKPAAAKGEKTDAKKPE